MTPEAPVPHSDAPPSLADHSSAGELLCPFCGYDQRGIESRRCPECGREVDRVALQVQVPWARRRQIGRVRAYCRTVSMAVEHPIQLARQADAPLTYTDARRFWVITCLLLGGAFAIFWLFYLYDASNMGQLGQSVGLSMGSVWPTQPTPMWDLLLPLVAVYELPPTVPICLLLFLFAATGSSSYWFHPARLSVERQNRAIAASYYTCGPLALHLLAVIPLALAYYLDLDPTGMRSEIILVIVCLILIVAFVYFPPLGWLHATVQMARHVRGYSIAGTLGLCVLFALQWAVIALLCWGVLPWIVGLIILMVASLT